MSYQLVRTAREFGPNLHAERNLRYGDYAYTIHLQTVANFGKYFRHLLQISTDQAYEVEAALWLHDTIEDCGINYQKIKTLFNENVAEYVWSVTGFGRNRVERNASVEERIKGKIIPTYIKLCDKLANMVFSKYLDSNSGMYEKYVAEWSSFKEKYYLPDLKEMFDYVDNLIDLK